MVRKTRLIWLVVLALAGGAAAFWLDMPAFRFVTQYIQPHVKRQLPNQVLDGFQSFPQVVPLAMIGWLVCRLDRGRGRKVALRMIVAYIVAGGVCSGGAKLLVGRYRPGNFKGQTWRQTWIDVGLHPRDSKQQSFFSGHSASAFAMATVLSACYPPVRPVAMTLGAGCAGARVATHQHWLSDAYVGSVAGLAVGWLMVPAGLRRQGKDRGLLQDKMAEQIAGVQDRWSG